MTSSEPSNPTCAVATRNLTKSYGRSRGISDINLDICRGEVVGLLGANGAGKTTLMRTLLDFIRPTAGSLSVLGLDSVKDSVAVRRRCSYLPGELVIPPRMTGNDAIRRFTFARNNVEPKRISQLAERLDVDLDRRVGDLSKGNKQKIGLVLAFAPNAELLVLDEPTSGLDPLLQREFAALVGDVTNRGGTVLLSSHVMAEVESVADRVALLRAGELVVVDDLKSLQARSRRRATLRLVGSDDGPMAARRIAALTGVSHVAQIGPVVRFAIAGPMDALIKVIAGYAVDSFEVVHEDLEDAFFEIYDAPARDVGHADVAAGPNPSGNR